MSAVDLQEVHDFLIDVAHKAGQVIIKATPTAAGLGTKSNSVDFVTEVDQAVEKMIFTLLRERYPDFDFMGEESFQPDDRLNDKPTFVVDPLDGTTNFIHGHPHICIALGLTIEKKPVVGVIYNPFENTLYTGVKGKGSYLTNSLYNRARLPLKCPEPMNDLSDCLIAVEWGAARHGNDYNVKVNTFRKLCASKETGGAMVHGIRSPGSVALNICAVAAGFLDVTWDCGCYAWDVCAGWVILEEAGGKMIGAHPNDWQPQVEQRRYLAVRAGQGQDEIIKEFWGCVEGRLDVGYDSVS